MKSGSQQKLTGKTKAEIHFWMSQMPKSLKKCTRCGLIKYSKWSKDKQYPVTVYELPNGDIVEEAPPCKQII